MDNKNSGINTLREFGNVFQNRCIASMISDRAFLERIFDIVSPDYFDSDANKWLVRLIMDYFQKYKSTPTKEVVKIELQRVADPVLQAALTTQSSIVFSELVPADAQYVKDEFLRFCKNCKLKNAILSSYDYLKMGDYDSIWNVVNEASRAGVEKNLGHEYLNELNLRLEESVRDCIKTDWPLIDAHMDGGLGKGELGFIVAPAGSGKSWFLAHLGAAAMRQGKNVMHFTMELNEKYVGLRYDAIFSQIAFQDVRKNPEVVKKAIADIKGKLFIKYFPMKTASAATLKMHIERLQMITGITIDMVIIDYADILRPFVTEKNANSYKESGNVYEELRSVLGELQIPGWTASQANRSAHEDEIIEAHSVADSYRKIMTGDFIMSLSRKMSDKKASTGRVHVMKNRFGADGMTYQCNFDTSIGRIELHDPKSIEGMELIKKAKEEEKTLREMTAKHWDKHHKKSEEDNSDY